MKIRIGYGLGVTASPTTRSASAPSSTPSTARLRLAVGVRAAGRPLPRPGGGDGLRRRPHPKLKFGMSVMVLPGRNPVLVAKPMASLDRLSGGRLLPAFGLGAPNRPSGRRSASTARTGPPGSTRPCRSSAACGLRTRSPTRQALPLRGRHGAAQAGPGHHLDVWLGGAAPSELRRVGRLADGWLP